MKKIFLLLGIVAETFFCFALKAEEKKTICLNMIVKNESKVIRRCLESVKPWIDTWVIVDTGSSDGTQEIIKEYLKEIPGVLYERPWVDFGHNRQEALELAKGKADYLLFMDADEKLVWQTGSSLLKPEKDYYLIEVRGSSPDFLSYARYLLVKSCQNWQWKDILHEYLVPPPEATTYETLTNVTCFTDSDGFRAEDPKKFYKDAEVLEKALEKDPTNSRYMFYLAQSYCNAKEFEKALSSYEKRASMLYGWAHEVFWSLYTAAYLQEALKKPVELFISNYCKAFQTDPKRAEPLYRLANYYNSVGNHALAYAAAKWAVTLHVPSDRMYVQSWIYDYGALCALAESALLLGKYEEAIATFQKILVKETLPADVRERVENNLRLASARHLAAKER
jgi:glycosyltransferase involved in cell wall biosynthesis